MSAVTHSANVRYYEGILQCYMLNAQPHSYERQESAAVDLTI